ncbi:hypothetical protein ACL02T_15275 [Pseudonocardia sp. RS010]|uniref:hypothetical protein n=1 Tax=Pseudonocardia sp. RS010 TaxID=3385979 RepID=UPI0039A3D2C7
MSQHSYNPNQPPPGWYPQPKRKRRVWPWIVLVLVIVVAPIVGFGACTAAVDSAITEAGKPVTYTYRVTGSGSDVRIDYQTDTGSASVSDVSLPWEIGETFSSLINFVHVSAILDQDGGKVTCEVLQDGKVVASNTASGPFASCTAMPPAN